MHLFGDIIRFYVIYFHVLFFFFFFVDKQGYVFRDQTSSSI